MKYVILFLVFGVMHSFAAGCVTVDAKGNPVVVDCAKVQSSQAEQIESERNSELKKDSAEYKTELDVRIQERLRAMNQSDAEKVKSSIDAAKNRTEQRKSEFLDQK